LGTHAYPEEISLGAQQLAGGALPGSALPDTSSGSEGGRRRTSGVLADDPVTLGASTLLVRRWDAGPPGVPEGRG